MNCIRLKSGHPSGISQIETMHRWNLLHRIFDQADESLVFRNARNISLWIIERTQLGWDELGEVHAVEIVWRFGASEGSTLSSVYIRRSAGRLLDLLHDPCHFPRIGGPRIVGEEFLLKRLSLVVRVLGETMCHEIDACFD